MCCGWGERESIWNSEEYFISSVKNKKMLSHPKGTSHSRMNVFFLVFSLLIAVSVLVYPATALPPPVAPRHLEWSTEVKSSLNEARPLRLRRDAEVSFGNSQNEPRDKKSADASQQPAAADSQHPAEPATGPAAAEPAAAGPAVAGPAVPDSASITQIATESTPAASPSIVSSHSDSIDSSSHDKETEVAPDGIPVVEVLDKSLDLDDDHGIKPDEKSSEELGGGSSDEALKGVKVEGAEEIPDEGVKIDELEDHPVVLGLNDDEALGGTQHPSQDIKSDKGDSDQVSKSDQGSKEEKEDESHKQISRITKRSAPSMTAENMGKSLLLSERHRRAPSRTKRDLGYDELRDILSSGSRYPLDGYGEEEDGYPYVSDSLDYTEEDDGDWMGPSLDDNEFLLPSRKEEAIEKEMIRYEVLQRLLKEKEDEKAKEAILDYLIRAAEERLDEAVEEEREAEVEEKIEKLSDARQMYQDDSYQVNKRYPYYSYEPFGGPWGALVPGVKRSRTRYDWLEPDEDEESYARLYKLAEELGDN